jgi:hypothetical protein
MRVKVAMSMTEDNRTESAKLKAVYSRHHLCEWVRGGIREDTEDNVIVDCES